MRLRVIVCDKCGEAVAGTVEGTTDTLASRAIGLGWQLSVSYRNALRDLCPICDRTRRKTVEAKTVETEVAQ